MDYKLQGFVAKSNHGSMLQYVTWQKINGVKFKNWILRLVTSYKYIFTKESNQGNMLQNNPTK